MITRIEATNYRCYERISVASSEFQVLAGANGSGKTTFLDIPVLLGDMLRARNVAAAFIERVLQRGARAASLSELPFRGGDKSFSLALEAKLPEPHFQALLEASSDAVKADPTRWPTHLRYEVRLAIVDDDRDLQVQDEYLFAFSPSAAGDAQDADRRFIIHRTWKLGFWTSVEIGDVVSRTSEVSLTPELPDAQPHSTTLDRTKLALARLGYEAQAEFGAGRWLLDLLLDGVVFFDPTWTKLRSPSPPGLPRRLMPSGENIPWLALRLQTEQPDQFQAWVEHVRTALPQILSIEIREREEDHHAYFRIAYEGGFEVTSTGLSEGTLRILALTLVAYILDPPRLLIVEEPENSIHPQAIETIMQSLRSLYDSQVWVSTHSPVVLADRGLAELLITRLDRTGAAQVIPGPEHPRLAAWKGAIDLGSLFATGVFE